ncbi:hypothetical protein JXC34_03085 [Candidatus Woesearchaeota archaeon]|nr:hypothetical protein [Candidatus Woesearchaeota archaeon]
MLEDRVRTIPVHYDDLTKEEQAEIIRKAAGFNGDRRDRLLQAGELFWEKGIAFSTATINKDLRLKRIEEHMEFYFGNGNKSPLQNYREVVGAYWGNLDNTVWAFVASEDDYMNSVRLPSSRTLSRDEARLLGIIWSCGKNTRQIGATDINGETMQIYSGLELRPGKANDELLESVIKPLVEDVFNMDVPILERRESSRTIRLMRLSSQAVATWVYGLGMRLGHKEGYSLPVLDWTEDEREGFLEGIVAIFGKINGPNQINFYRKPEVTHKIENILKMNGIQYSLFNNSYFPKIILYSESTREFTKRYELLNPAHIRTQKRKLTREELEELFNRVQNGDLREYPMGTYVPVNHRTMVEFVVDRYQQEHPGMFPTYSFVEELGFNRLLELIGKKKDDPGKAYSGIMKFYYEGGYLNPEDPNYNWVLDLTPWLCMKDLPNHFWSDLDNVKKAVRWYVTLGEPLKRTSILSHLPSTIFNYISVCEFCNLAYMNEVQDFNPESFYDFFKVTVQDIDGGVFTVNQDQLRIEMTPRQKLILLALRPDQIVSPEDFSRVFGLGIIDPVFDDVDYLNRNYRAQTGSPKSELVGYRGIFSDTCGFQLTEPVEFIVHG